MDWKCEYVFHFLLLWIYCMIRNCGKNKYDLCNTCILYFPKSNIKTGVDSQTFWVRLILCGGATKYCGKFIPFILIVNENNC